MIGEGTPFDKMCNGIEGTLLGARGGVAATRRYWFETAPEGRRRSCPGGWSGHPKGTARVFGGERTRLPFALAG